MADVTLTYKGSTIAEMSNTGSKTLKTSGKYCEGDIGVSYVKPSSGGGGFWDEDYAKQIIGRTITSINFPSGLTEIGRYAFFECNDLNLASLPQSLTKIGNSAFRFTKISLTSLPVGVTNIWSYTFADCSEIKTIEFHENIDIIDMFAFYNCTGLTSVTFKGTPSTIINNAFNKCTNLTNIYVPWAEGAVSGAPWGATNATIHYNTTT